MAVTHRMRSGMEFSTCGIRWVLRKFRILQSFGLQIFKLETEYSSSYKHTRPSKLEQRVTVCKNKELQQWWACFRITIVQGAWQWVAGQRHCDSKNTHCLDSSRRQRSGLGPRNLHVKSSSSDSDGQLRLETTDYTRQPCCNCVWNHLVSFCFFKSSWFHDSHSPSLHTRDTATADLTLQSSLWKGHVRDCLFLQCQDTGAPPQ